MMSIIAKQIIRRLAVTRDMPNEKPVNTVYIGWRTLAYGPLVISE